MCAGFVRVFGVHKSSVSLLHLPLTSPSVQDTWGVLSLYVACRTASLGCMLSPWLATLRPAARVCVQQSRERQPAKGRTHMHRRLHTYQHGSATRRHGEVSRAMRNRGIELFLLPAAAGASTAAPTAATAGATSGPTAAPHSQPLAVPGEDGASSAAGDAGSVAGGGLGPSEGGDLQALLAAEDMPGWALPAAMAAAHQAVAQLAATRHRSAPDCFAAPLRSGGTASSGACGSEAVAANCCLQSSQLLQHNTSLVDSTSVLGSLPCIAQVILRWCFAMNSVPG